jgi:hypothetical protein
VGVTRLIEIGELSGKLTDRALDVAERYAPDGILERGRYWVQCPWRDSTRESFCINITGTYAGRWYDWSRKEGGDLLDLIRRKHSLTLLEAIDEACRFLGIANETPEQRRERERRDAKEREARAERARLEAEKAAAERAREVAKAHALWLEARPIDGTPAAEYLSARGVGIERLGRSPLSLRFVPALRYYHLDKKTRQVVEGVFPAMVAAIHGPRDESGHARFMGVHRTWLARDDAGVWRKAPVPKPKKVMGEMQGGYIRLWAGSGRRPGARLNIAEGIENALSAVFLQPSVPAAAAISLGNLSEIVLPAAVRHVTLIRDNDTKADLRAMADRARERWLGDGRTVAEWPNAFGFKDLNDALQAALEMGPVPAKAGSVA